MHVHLHAAATRRSRRPDTRPTPKAGARVMSRHALEGLVDSLDRTINALEWRPSGTVWADYYDNTNYSDTAFLRKRELVESALDRLQPKVVWDLGANDGTFSRLASSRGMSVLSFDVDPAAVEKNYRRVVRDRERDLLPLLMDLTNPSPSLGWAGEERESLVERGPADRVHALALVHHLAIGHNVPFDRIARFLARLAAAVVIEFVPKEDSQVQRMLATREDVFARYTPDSFEEAFSTAFDLDARLPVADSSRTIYIWRRR
jgi:ribosomal protein L11 methylase PrmA